MPRNNKQRNRRPRRKSGKNNKYNNKYGSGGNLSRINNPLSSDSTMVTLKYMEVVTLSPGANFFEYIFTGNGLFDPNVTGTGGQPAGYDQWANFYTKYLVLGSKIKLTVVNNSATNNAAISVFPTDQTSGVVDFSSATAQPYSRWNVINFTGSISKMTLRNSIMTSKVWGKDCRYDDLFTATVSNNPSNIWYWCINGDSQPGGNISVTLYVEIFYKTMFFKRVAPDLSISVYTKKVHNNNVTNKLIHPNNNNDEKDEFVIS